MGRPSRTRISTSLRGRSSPRATLPKTAAYATPCRSRIGAVFRLTSSLVMLPASSRIATLGTMVAATIEQEPVERFLEAIPANREIGVPRGPNADTLGIPCPWSPARFRTFPARAFASWRRSPCRWMAFCASISANPTCPPRDYIKQAAARAMEEGYTFYTENAGLALAAPGHRRKLPPPARRGAGPGPRDRGHRFRRAGAQHGHPLRARPGDEAIMLTPAWPNGSSSVMMANAMVRHVPHPLGGLRYRVDFDALGSRRHAAHPPAGLHLAFQSAGLGGHRGGAAQAARFRAAARSLAAGRRGLRPAVLRRRAPGRPGPFDSAHGHARRRRDGGAFLFQELLHDRLAPGLAGGAARPGRQGHRS